MREIKFRAWDAFYGRMEVVTKLDWRFLPKYLMQSTGLRDKNGKEIFEGDVVMRKEYSGMQNAHYDEIRNVVVYLAPQFYLAPKLTEKVAVETFSTPTIEEEVIGNIYENPELLNAA